MNQNYCRLTAGQLNPSVGLGVGYFSASGESFSVSGDTPLTPVSATESVFSATVETLSVSIGNYAAWVDSQYFGFNFGSATGLSYEGQNGVDRFGNIYVGTGTLTTVDGVSTITLPVFADLYIYVVGDSHPSDVIWTGQIVASTVPEPSTLVLAMAGALSAATLSFFRRRAASREPDYRSSFQRDEDQLPFAMQWVRHHDRYERGGFLDADKPYWPKIAVEEGAEKQGT